MNLQFGDYQKQQLAVVQLPGHQPGNCEGPGLVPGFNSLLEFFYCCCFLGQETLHPLPQPYPAVKLGYTVCHVQGSAEERPLADATYPVKITEEEKNCLKKS